MVYRQVRRVLVLRHGRPLADARSDYAAPPLVALPTVAPTPATLQGCPRKAYSLQLLIDGSPTTFALHTSPKRGMGDNDLCLFRGRRVVRSRWDLVPATSMAEDGLVVLPFTRAIKPPQNLSGLRNGSKALLLASARPNGRNATLRAPATIEKPRTAFPNGRYRSVTALRVAAGPVILQKEKGMTTIEFAWSLQVSAIAFRKRDRGRAIQTVERPWHLISEAKFASLPSAKRDATYTSPAIRLR